MKAGIYDIMNHIMEQYFSDFDDNTSWTIPRNCCYTICGGFYQIFLFVLLLPSYLAIIDDHYLMLSLPVSYIIPLIFHYWM